MELSFFEGDFIAKLIDGGIPGVRTDNPAALLALTIAITWIPPFLLSFVDSAMGYRADSGFVEDYASYTQLFVGVPLLLWARHLLDQEWRRVHKSAIADGLLEAEHRAIFSQSVTRIRNVLLSRRVTLVIVIGGYLMSVFWAVGELTNGNDTYHARAVSDSAVELPTFTGTFMAFVSVPAYTTLVVFWITRYAAWVAYLRCLSQARPALDGFHPDKVGGLRFLTTPISAFGLLIFALGVVQVAITLYKTNVESLTLVSAEVLTGPLLYAVFAPILFIAPFFFFTRRLLHAKRQSLSALNREAATLLQTERKSDKPLDLARVNEVAAAYEHVGSMRIWPLDLGSLSRLFLSAILPTLPLLAKFIELPAPIQAIIDAFK